LHLLLLCYCVKRKGKVKDIICIDKTVKYIVCIDKTIIAIDMQITRATMCKSMCNSSNFTTPLPTPLLSSQLFPKNNLTTSDIILVIIYVNILFFGVLGNFLVIRYFGFYRKSKSLYHLYLIHLAIADLISSTVSPAHFVYGVVTGNLWHLGETSCTVVSVIGPLTVNVSAWLLASIAHERYRGIVNPFKPRLTKLQIHVAVAMIWLISMITLVPYVYAMQLLDGKYCIPVWKDSRYELTSAIGTLVLQSILPIAFMVFTVSKIFIVLKNRMRMHSFKGKQKVLKTTSKSKLLEGEITNENSDIVDNKLPNTTKVRKSFRLIKSESFRNRSLRARTITNGGGSPKLKQSDISRRLALRSARYTIQEVPNIEMKIQLSAFRRFSAPGKSNEIEHMTDSLSNLQDTKGMLKELERRSKTFSTVLEPSVKQLKTKQRCFSLDSGLNANKKHRFQHVTTMRAPKSEINLQTERNKKSGSVISALKKVISVENKRATTNSNRQRERITMLVVTFSVFVVCSLPYNFFYVMCIILVEFLQSNQLELLSDLNFWLSTLVVANSITNCCIYAGMDQGFRKYCLKLVTCNKKLRKQKSIIRKIKYTKSLTGEHTV